ncbi:MAG TPA: glycosyltransferase [Candidatus Aquicultor sp.]|jgi:glycosyltransferase involved in cell wall biosynthesis
MPNRLNILFVTSWYPNDQVPISALFVKEHAKAAALHNNVVVLSIGDKSPEVNGLFDVDIRIEDNIKTIRLTHRAFSISKLTASSSFLNSLRYIFKIRKDGFKPDIIHANIFAAGVPSVLFGKLTGTKVVITEHFSGFARGTLGRLDIAKAKFAFNHVDMILPVSSVLQQSIESYGVRGNFRIVPNVVDTDLFKPNPDCEPNSTTSVKQILMVAEQVPVKGIPYALEAIKLLKSKRNDFVLNIFGDGEKRAEYEELSSSLGLEDCVKFHGAQPKPTIAEYMQKSDFIMLSSLYETLSCVLIEAMACDTPIVASRVGAVPSLVPEHAGILVEPGNIAELADAIEHMLDNSDSYKKNDISDYVRSKFSTEVIGEELNSIYHEVFAAKKRKFFK